MAVETPTRDLGEADVSSPKVKEVRRSASGKVEAVVVQKGVVFRKEVVVPGDRLQSVTEDSTAKTNGKVLLDISKSEAEHLSAQGSEQLAASEDVLGQVEEELPTAEGLRRLEAEGKQKMGDAQARHGTTIHRPFWQLLGPGFLSGMAGNDASAVGAYAIDGAAVGFGHLWLMLLSTPLYQAVQYTCSKIGRARGVGLADLLRIEYSRPVAVLASLILVVANLALLAADLVAVSSGLEFRIFTCLVPLGLDPKVQREITA